MYLKFKKSEEKSEILNLSEEETKIEMIEVMSIRPNSSQPRKIFEDNGIIRLADSIKKYGIIHPLTVRKAMSVQNERDNYKYELISGERRLRAAMMIGIVRVPCIVKACSGLESAEMAIIENILRHDLNFFEQAEAFSMLITKFGLTQSQVAERLSTGQSSVANKLRLLRLTAEERGMIIENKLTERHARALVRINDENLRLELLRHVIKQRLNVAATELLIERLLNSSVLPSESVPGQVARGAERPGTSVNDVFEAVKRCISRSFGKNSVGEFDSVETESEYVLTIRVKK